MNSMQKSKGLYKGCNGAWVKGWIKGNYLGVHISKEISIILYMKSNSFVIHMYSWLPGVSIISLNLASANAI